MGGREVVLHGAVPGGETGTVEIKISGDRGHWVITFRIEPLSRHLTPEAWAAYLDGTAVQAPDLDREVAFIRNRLPDAVAAVRNEPNVESQVCEIGRDYMRRLLDAPVGARN
jgi:hypothetical protein